MAFDAFNPVYFTPSVMPQAPAPSPQAAYDASLHAAQVTAASLQVQQTPVFVPPPVQPQPSFASVGFGQFAALFNTPSPGAPRTVTPSQVPPTITIDSSGGLVMPPPAPQNPVTFPDPNPTASTMTPTNWNAFWGTFLEGR